MQDPDKVRPFHIALAWLQMARPEVIGALTAGTGPLHEALAATALEEYRATLQMAGVNPNRAGEIAAEVWDAASSAPLDESVEDSWVVAGQRTMHLLDHASELQRDDHVRLRSASPLLPMLRALAERPDATFARIIQLAGGDVETMARRLAGVHRPVSSGGKLAERFTVSGHSQFEPQLTRYTLHDVEWRTELIGEIHHGATFGTMTVRRRFCDAVIDWAGLGSHPNVLGCVGGRDVDGSILVVTERWDRTLAEALAAPGTQELAVDDLIKIAQCAAFGLQHLHAAGLSHGAVTPEAVVLTGKGASSARLRSPGLGAALESLLTNRVPSPEGDVRQWGTMVHQLFEGRDVPEDLVALLERTSGREPAPLTHVLEVITRLGTIDGTLAAERSPTLSSLVAEALTRESLRGRGGAATGLLEATGWASSDPYVLLHAARLLPDDDAGQELLDDGLAKRPEGPDHRLVRAGLSHFRNHPATADQQLGPADPDDPPLARALRLAVDTALEQTEGFDSNLDADLVVAAVSADGSLMAGLIGGADAQSDESRTRKYVEGPPSTVVLTDLRLQIVQQIPTSLEPPDEGTPFAVSNDGAQLAWCSDEFTVVVVNPRRGIVVQTHHVRERVRHLQFTMENDCLIAVTMGGAVARLGIHPPERPQLQPRPVPAPARVTPPADLLRHVRRPTTVSEPTTAPRSSESATSPNPSFLRGRLELTATFPDPGSLPSAGTVERLLDAGYPLLHRPNSPGLLPGTTWESLSIWDVQPTGMQVHLMGNAGHATVSLAAYDRPGTLPTDVLDDPEGLPAGKAAQRWARNGAHLTVLVMADSPFTAAAALGRVAMALGGTPVRLVHLPATRTVSDGNLLALAVAHAETEDQLAGRLLIGHETREIAGGWQFRSHGLRALHSPEVLATVPRPRGLTLSRDRGLASRAKELRAGLADHLSDGSPIVPGAEIAVGELIMVAVPTEDDGVVELRLRSNALR